jgi:hypothetical protein
VCGKFWEVCEGVMWKLSYDSVFFWERGGDGFDSVGYFLVYKTRCGFGWLWAIKVFFFEGNFVCIVIVEKHCSIGLCSSAMWYREKGAVGWRRT